MEEIFLLLVAFQAKHFLSDYPLQTQYMLKKSNSKDWVHPLFSHAAVHGFITLLICYFFSGDISLSASLMFMDLFIHFTVDRIKASPNYLGRFKAYNKYFWWSLGADQMAHHLTHYAIIYILVF